MIFYKIDIHKWFHDFKSFFVMTYNGFIKGIDILDKVWSAPIFPEGNKGMYIYFALFSNSSKVV